jgi:monoamine oxidase
MLKPIRSVDVLIIGAGAAGLQTGRVLHSAKKSFLILEARDRIGGRVLTQNATTHPLAAIELGAEFIHGKASLTKQLLQEQGAFFYDLNFDYQEFENGQIKSVKNYWETLSKVFQKIKKKRIDESFADFLQAHPQLPLLQRKMASAFIEGFDAAELNQISTNALSEMKDQVQDEQERALAKPMFGYHSLLKFLALDFQKQIRLQHVVQTIAWKKNRVLVSGRAGLHQFSCAAKKIVITVPVGAMNSLHFHPRPPQLDYFKSLRMGQIIKIVLQMKPEFLGHFKNNQFPFVVSPTLHFKTWWGMEPLRIPQLVAWAGGKHARALNELSTSRRHALAIADLAKLAKISPAQVRKQLISIHEHDWENDPYAGGAYSYPAVQNSDSPSPLHSIDQTLYFAGEAYENEHQGTVEGALRSGLAAALKIR